jgi:hypothetical protein
MMLFKGGFKCRGSIVVQMNLLHSRSAKWLEDDLGLQASVSVSLLMSRVELVYYLVLRPYNALAVFSSSCVCDSLSAFLPPFPVIRALLWFQPNLKFSTSNSLKVDSAIYSLMFKLFRIVIEIIIENIIIYLNEFIFLRFAYREKYD